jgi:hypothetical protein
MKHYRFRIPTIPDPSDRALAASCGGDVRVRAFRAAEQVLRMLASMKEGSVRVALRFCYDPDVPNQRARLRPILNFATEDTRVGTALRQLSTAGPLSSVYSFNPTDDNPSLAVGNAYEACCEIVRREDGWEASEKRKQNNEYIPEQYYSVSPLEARSENDWMALDRLLHRFDAPACVEVLVHPTCIEEERRAHYGYVTQLMQVNRYGNDLDPDAVGAQDRPSFSGWHSRRDSSRVQDPMADDVLREQEDMHDRMRQPHLHFAVRCWAEDPNEARLLAATVAEASLNEGQYRILQYDTGDLDKVRGASSELSILDRPLLEPSVWDGVWNNTKRTGLQRLVRLSRLGTVDELKGLFRLPVGRHGSTPRTLRQRTDPPPVSFPSVLIGDDLEVGDPPSRSYADDLGTVFQNPDSDHSEVHVDLGLLRKHMFLSGVSGSGKTTAVFNLLSQLAHHDIPFLVIEPAKTEYRTFSMLRSHPDATIRRLAHDVQVYTIGNEALSPFRFNPLAYPDGISLDEHIGSVLSSFQAAMPMGGPLEGLLAESVETVYNNVPEGQRFPRLKDLVATARSTVEEKGYGGDVQDNLSAALDVRVGLLVRRSLGKVFDCDESIPDLETLFTSNVVLEMDYLTREHTCLMTLFLLSSMREYVRVNRASGADLTHVTVLEEAHNIVGRSRGAVSTEQADPKAFAADYVSHMLAEMRALGEGLLIADQLPSAVSPEVVKSTGTKLAYRLVANDDREDLGGTMLMREPEQEEMVRLRPGEAYLYTEGLYRPRRVQGLGAHEYLARGHDTEDGELPPPPDREAFRRLIEDDDWFREARNRRLRSDLDDLSRRADRLEAACARAETTLDDVQSLLTDLMAGENVNNIDDRRASVLETAETLETRRTEALNGIEHTDPLHLAGFPDALCDAARSVRQRIGQTLDPKARAVRDVLRSEARTLQQLNQTSIPGPL